MDRSLLPRFVYWSSISGHIWSPWSDQETKALKEAVNEYGVGQWAAILRDSVYGQLLESRSNVDLKDKWRVLERARLRAGGQPTVKPIRQGFDALAGITTDEILADAGIEIRRLGKRTARPSPAVVKAVAERKTRKIHDEAFIATAIENDEGIIRELAEVRANVEIMNARTALNKAHIDKQLILMEKSFARNDDLP